MSEFDRFLLTTFTSPCSGAGSALAQGLMGVWYAAPPRAAISPVKHFSPNLSHLAHFLHTHTHTIGASFQRPNPAARVGDLGLGTWDLSTPPRGGRGPHSLSSFHGLSLSSFRGLTAESGGVYAARGKTPRGRGGRVSTAHLARAAFAGPRPYSRELTAGQKTDWRLFYIASLFRRFL
jgi:hypothetical protein